MLTIAEIDGISGYQNGMPTVVYKCLHGIVIAKVCLLGLVAETLCLLRLLAVKENTFGLLLKKLSLIILMENMLPEIALPSASAVE